MDKMLNMYFRKAIGEISKAIGYLPGDEYPTDIFVAMDKVVDDMETILDSINKDIPLKDNGYPAGNDHSTGAGKPALLIIVEGGLIEDIKTTMDKPDLKVIVRDMDTEGMDIEDISHYDGKDFFETIWDNETITQLEEIKDSIDGPFGYDGICPDCDGHLIKDGGKFICETCESEFRNQEVPGDLNSKETEFFTNWKIHLGSPVPGVDDDFIGCNNVSLLKHKWNQMEDQHLGMTIELWTEFEGYVEVFKGTKDNHPMEIVVCENCEGKGCGDCQDVGMTKCNLFTILGDEKESPEKWVCEGCGAKCEMKTTASYDPSECVTGKFSPDWVKQ